MAIAAAVLAGAQAGPPSPVVERRETVVVRWDPMAKTCVPKVRGVETGDVATDAGRRALADAIPDRGATLYLLGSGELPFACSLGVVETLKRAGHYGRIDYGAQPVAR